MRFLEFRLGVTDPPLSTILGFTAHSVEVKNPTNQFVQVTPTQFVRPQTTGAVITIVDEQARAKIGAPSGITNPPTQAGQFVALTYYDTQLPPSPGADISTRAPSTEWRNPKELIFSTIFTAVAGGVFTADWSYTVPTGRRARLDSAQTIAEISVSDGVGAGTVIGATIQEKVGGVGTSLNLITSEIINGTVLGARADAALATSFELAAGDVISGVSGNPRAGASQVVVAERAHFVEGDA